jgi:olefin beta-lactone synthetase
VLVPSLASGAPVALPGRALARQVRRLTPQAIYLTPPAIRAALGAGTRFTGRVYSGSAPVSAALLTRVRAAGADAAFGVYALTEMLPVAAVSAGEKAAHAGDGDLVGAPLPGVDVDVDASGQLLLRESAMAHRYLGEPPMTHVSTGDIGHLRDDRIVLAGRGKDMILRGAENIYPGLYEPTLHVTGVNLALLVGVRATDGDERVVAVVEPARGAQAATIRAALAGALARMGAARPDAVVFATVPVAGRSRKPDRAATTALAARLMNGRT